MILINYDNDDQGRGMMMTMNIAIDELENTVDG